MAFKIVPNEDVSMLMRPSHDVTTKSFIAGRDPEPIFALPQAPALRGIRRNLQQEICNLTNEDEDTLALPPPSSKELVQVYLRVKPKTLEEEKYPETSQDHLDKTSSDDMIRIESAHQLCVEAPIDSAAFKNSANGNGKQTHRFSFTKIFPSSTSQAELFDEVVKPRLRDFMEGQNQLLFTYGATCSGKTFTIQGDSTRPGIVPRALDVLFNSVGAQTLSQDDINMRPNGYNRVGALLPREKEKVTYDKKAIMEMGAALSQALDVAEDCSNVSQTSVASLSSRRRDENVIDVKGNEQLHYAIWVSFAEVYNENIYDLFEKIPEVKNKSDKPRRNPLKLAEDKGWKYIKSLTEVPVSSADEAYQLLLIGRQNLQFAATRLNHHSSRSHCVFTIKMLCVADKDQPTSARVSVLSFCDLAGSERIKKTLNTGERQKEAGSINTSLLVLGRCIKTIRKNQLLKDPKRHEIVPFRDSKLTNLFKSYLQGTGKVSMVVNISQSPYLFDESLQVLKFSAVTSKVHIEAFKEPKAKPTPQEKQNKRKTRFSILVENNKQSLFTAGGRGSIAWENPQYRSTICPQPIDQTVLEETENEMADETVIDANYNGLMKVIENLKNQLIEEKQKNLRQEQEIRTELCEEFNKMLVEIEASSEQRLQEEKDRASELSEWRISKLEEALRENRQRRRLESEGPDSAALEEKEAEVERLKEELDAIKTLHNSLMEDNKKAQSDKNALKTELKSANETNEMLESRVQQLEKTVESTNEALKLQTSDPKIRDLEAKVEDSLKALNEKDSQIRDLKTLLDEAGEDYLKMDNDIKKQTATIGTLQRTVDLKEETIRDMEVQCDELKALLDAATTRAEEKDLQIFEMEEKIETLSSEKEEEQKWSAKMASEQQITNLNDEVEALKSEKKKLRSNLDSKEADLAAKEKEIDDLERETKRLVQIENQAQEKAKWHEKEVGSLRKQLKELTSKLTEAEKEGKDKKSIIANLELAVAASKKEDTAIEALKTELDKKRSEVEEFQHQAAKLQSTVEAMEYDTKRLKDDRTQLMEHYEQKLKKVTEDLNLERRETSKLRQVMSNTTPHKREANNELILLREEVAKKSELIKTLAAKVTTPKRSNEEGDEAKAIEALEEKHKRELQKQEERYAKIIAEFKDTNSELLKHVDGSAAKRIMKTKRTVEDSDDEENVPPSSSSKQDKSTIEATPAASDSATGKARRGKRGRKKMSATTQVSFDDDVTSNTLDNAESPEENSKAKRPRRGARVSRNSRPSRKYSTKSEDTSIDTTQEQPNESASTLQAIQENPTFATPANRKRKLFTNTPKPHEFTPQEEENAPVDSPHSIVRRQLRSRNIKIKN